MKYAEPNISIIENKIYLEENLKDKISNIEYNNEDQNYQYLEPLFENKLYHIAHNRFIPIDQQYFVLDYLINIEFTILWNKAIKWLKDNLCLNATNKEIVKFFINGYDNIQEFLEDYYSDMLEYPKEFIFFDLNGDQTDIHDEYYNNDGLCIQIL